jgi:hypothetical protein
MLRLKIEINEMLKFFILNLLKMNIKKQTMDSIVFPRTCNPHYNYPLFLSAIIYLVRSR